MTGGRDHHFPAFHVRPRTGFVNDPNGPIILAGELHLYFQYRTASSGDSPVRWGHASSRDYVNWAYHPPAITPSPGGPDVDGAWSGNTVRDGARVVAFYSAYHARRRYQSVVSATSDDGGYHFGPGSQAVADPGPGERVTHFRDPFVWRHGEGWRMVVGSGTEGKAASARLYESSDLVSWRPAGALAVMRQHVVAGEDTGAMWECPQVATLDGTDALIVSPWSPGTELAPVLTLTGLTDEAGPRVGRLDHGRNFYAASVLRDSPFGPLAWGWATEGRSANWCVAADWSGMLTLPRRLSLRPDGTVASSPLPVMTSLRRESVGIDRGSAARLRSTGLSAQAEIRLELCAAARRAPVTARLRFSAAEHLDITIDFAAGTVSIDCSAASADPRAHRDSAYFTEPLCAQGAPVTLTAYLDGSILELFTSSGRCATVRMYPTSPPPWHVDVDGSLMDDDLRCWVLRPPG